MNRSKLSNALIAMPPDHQVQLSNPLIILQCMVHKLWVLIMLKVNTHQLRERMQVLAKLEESQVKAIEWLYKKWRKDIYNLKMVNKCLISKTNIVRIWTLMEHGQIEKRNGTSLTRDYYSQWRMLKLQMNGLISLML